MINEPWFNPAYGWLPGTLLGVLGGSLGGLAGFLAPQGKARSFVVGALWILTIGCALMLGAGILGFLMDQPYGVWYGLGLAGVIGVPVFGCNLPVILKAYRRAEERRMQAKDIQV